MSTTIKDKRLGVTYPFNMKSCYTTLAQSRYGYRRNNLHPIAVPVLKPQSNHGSFTISSI